MIYPNTDGRCKDSVEAIMSVTFTVSAEATAKLGEPMKYEAIDPFRAIEVAARIRPEAAGANFTSLLPTPDRQVNALHGFVRAIHESFGSHYPLVLSPDDVWLTIAQGFAHHVNANTTKL